MTNELAAQQKFWNDEIQQFGAIYTHGKSPIGNWLDRFFRWDMQARFEYTLRHAEPIEGKTVLDVGCGTSVYGIEFARKGARKIVGLDIADAMIRASQAAAIAANFQDRMEFHQTDILGFHTNESFDISIGIGLFDYIRDALPVLTAMRKLTTGKVIVSFPRLNTWRAPVRKIRLALKGCPVYFYTCPSLERLLRQAGFGAYSIETIGKLYCVTATPAQQIP